MDRILKEIDSDDNGFIDYEEFVKAAMGSKFNVSS